VRELHVYGQLIPTKQAIAETSAGVSDAQHSQHVGFGTRMMLRAEAIALENGFRRMAVISGVGAQSWRRYGKVDRLWRSTAVHA
jgi:elongator complex protein 3